MRAYFAILAILSILAPAAANAGAKQHVVAQLRQGALFGCWVYHPHGAAPNLICFNRMGVMSGITYETGEPRDWKAPYALDENRVLGQSAQWQDNSFGWGPFKYFTIRRIGAFGMDVEAGRGVVRYHLLCRSEEENPQCERLNQTAD